jgi:hypothetical protein
MSLSLQTDQTDSIKVSYRTRQVHDKIKAKCFWICLTLISPRTVYDPVSLSKPLKVREHKAIILTVDLHEYETCQLFPGHNVPRRSSTNILTCMADVSVQLMLHNEEFITDTGHLVLAYWNPGGYNGLVNMTIARGGSEFWFRIFMVNIHL